jgi:REP element-mobilizing transposase RayT
MTNYRRDFLDGGSDVFTANLADRRPTRLTEPIGRLRSAFCEVRVPYPFTIKAAVIRPDHRHAISTLPEKDANFVLALPARLAEIRSPRRVNPGAKAALMSRQPNAKFASFSGRVEIACR